VFTSIISGFGTQVSRVLQIAQPPAADRAVLFVFCDLLSAVIPHSNFQPRRFAWRYSHRKAADELDLDNMTTTQLRGWLIEMGKHFQASGFMSVHDKAWNKGEGC